MQKKILLYFLLTVFSLNFSDGFAQSPYKLTWGKEAAIFGAGLATGVPALIFMFENDKIPDSEILSLDKSNINSFDRFATNYYSENLSNVSDVLLWTSAVAPALLLLSPDVRSGWFETGTMYAETVVLAAALPHLVKGLVTRYRPFTYNPDAPLTAKTNADAGRSFFSGHSTLAFASAVFLAKVYSDYYPSSKYRSYVWTGSLLLAATVGSLRIFSGMHFPTDVLTGAVVGSALGWLIPELHKTKPGNANLGIGFYGINFSYTF